MQRVVLAKARRYSQCMNYDQHDHIPVLTMQKHQEQWCHDGACVFTTENEKERDQVTHFFQVSLCVLVCMQETVTKHSTSRNRFVETYVECHANKYFPVQTLSDEQVSRTVLNVYKKLRLSLRNHDLQRSTLSLLKKIITFCRLPSKS